MVAQMADSHDNHPNTDPSGRPSGAALMPGDVAAGQAIGEVASEAVDGVIDETAANNIPTPPKSRSNIWDHFKKTLGTNGKEMAEC
jgi:hypothetical protein